MQGYRCDTAAPPDLVGRRALKLRLQSKRSGDETNEARHNP